MAEIEVFGFFKRRRTAAIPKSITLPFKSEIAAFEYCCRFMDCKLDAKIMLPALVLDAAKEFGTAMAVSRKSDGVQLAALRIPSDNGGFVVMAETLSAHGPTLVPGQLVAWRALMYSMELGYGIAQTGGDKRSGWIGIIFATLIPTWSDGLWLIDKKFNQ